MMLKKTLYDKLITKFNVVDTKAPSRSHILNFKET